MNVFERKSIHEELPQFQMTQQRPKLKSGLKIVPQGNFKTTSNFQTFSRLFEFPKAV